MKRIASLLALAVGLCLHATASAQTACSNPRQMDVTFGGTYSGSTSYKCNEIVVKGGVSYLSLYSGNNTDPADGVHWKTLGISEPQEVRFLPAAICNGGVAYSAALSTFDNQQPQLGCVAPATSSVAYMAFQAAASPVQYATFTFVTPPNWTGSDVIVTFKGTATTGNVGWIVESGCTNPNGDLSAPTYGTATTITTTVSGTAGGTVNSATLSNIAAPGTNGCVAGTTAPGSIVTVRIHRSASDTQSGDANLLGVTLTTKRSS